MRGEHRRDADGVADDADDNDTGRALGLTEALAGRFVHGDGTLSDGRVAFGRLRPAEAWAFSPACRHIARVRVAGAALDVDVLDAGVLVRRFRVDRT